MDVWRAAGGRLAVARGGHDCAVEIPSPTGHPTTGYRAGRQHFLVEDTLSASLQSFPILRYELFNNMNLEMFPNVLLLVSG